MSSSISMSNREVYLRFIFGGLANSTSSFCIHPMDTIKIRLQVDNELSGKKNIFRDRYYKGVFRGMARFVKEEGFVALYRGIPPSILRELTYSSVRAGTYEPLKAMMGGTDRRNTSLRIKLAAGSVAGLLGSCFTTPTDIVKVRMQADGHKNTERVYRNSWQCFRVVYKELGLRGMFTGATPNMVRAICLTSMQFPVYDHTKHKLLDYELLEEGQTLHFVSSMVAGLAAAIVANPADIVKTRIMNQRKLEKLNYVSPIDTFIKTIKSEGLLGLFKGTIASWLRLGPGICISFLTLEQLRKMADIHPI